MGQKKDLHLLIEGMHCDACVKRVTAALQKVVGVELKKVEVGLAEVGYDPNVASPDGIAGAVNRIGFTARVEED